MIRDFRISPYTEVWEWEKMIGWVNDMRHARCDFNRDLVIIVAGEEGSGKSHDTLAIESVTDKHFDINSVLWKAEDYILSQMATTKERYGRLTSNDTNVLSEYGLDESEVDKYKIFPEGAGMIPDEAGTQINSRDSQSNRNKNQVKLFISNRSLSLIHWIVLPRPSTLDLYIRQDRARGMLWHEAIYNKREDNYTYYVFGYSKNDYKRIFLSSKWNIAFSDTDNLIRMFRPTFVVQLPDVNNFIDKNIMVEYNKRKLEFNLSLQSEALADMRGLNSVVGGEPQTIKVDKGKIAQEIMDTEKKYTINDIKVRYSIPLQDAREIKSTIKMFEEKKIML